VIGETDSHTTTSAIRYFSTLACYIFKFNYFEWRIS